MKLNLDKKFIDMEGKPVEGSEGKNMAQIFATRCLSVQNTKLFNIVKSCSWAQKLNDKFAIEIDLADKKLLIEFVENEADLPKYCKFQLLNELENCKEK